MTEKKGANWRSLVGEFFQYIKRRCGNNWLFRGKSKTPPPPLWGVVKGNMATCPICGNQQYALVDCDGTRNNHPHMRIPAWADDNIARAFHRMNLNYNVVRVTVQLFNDPYEETISRREIRNALLNAGLPYIGIPFFLVQRGILRTVDFHSVSLTELGRDFYFQF